MAEIKVRRSYEREGFKYPVFEYRPDWPYISIGFGDEKDYFIENLSLLVASGMGISAALEAIRVSVKTWKMKKIVTYVKDSVDAGLPLWKSFAATNFFPKRVVALVRAGEESGRLPEHLNLVTLQQQKEKIFRSRVRSALIYPGIVLFLAFAIMLLGAWFILPKIISVFNQSRSSLPIQTQILLTIGDFLQVYGLIAIPLAIGSMVILAYFLFFNKHTKFIGDSIVFHLPGINKLVQGVELARFGYTFGALLQAGFQISDALDSIKESSNYRAYRKLYEYIQKGVSEGESLQKVLGSYKHADRYIPSPIQQLIFSAEKSGRFPETFIKIGTIFEEKTEVMSRDLGTILEPMILIIVGLIVAFVVSAIITPYYGLFGQI